MQSRRAFIGHLAFAGVGFSALAAVEGCNATNVWSDIHNWIPVGIDAFDSIVSIVDPIMSPAIDAIASLVKAGFASLAAAVNSYLNAPAADKATWGEKIKLILSQLGTDLQSFLTAIGQSGNPLVKTIVALVQVIVDTIAGFINSIGTPAAGAFRAEFHVGSDRIVVVAAYRNRKRFCEVFNNALDSIGHPDLHIQRTVPLQSRR